MKNQFIQPEEAPESVPTQSAPFSQGIDNPGFTYPGVTPKMFDINQGTECECQPASYKYGSTSQEAENETGITEGY